MSREYVFNSFTAVTPHNSNKIQMNGLYVGGAGNVRLIADDGSDETFSGVAAGTILPVFGGVAVHTDTTATLMIALLSK